MSEIEVREIVGRALAEAQESKPQSEPDFVDGYIAGYRAAAAVSHARLAEAERLLWVAHDEMADVSLDPTTRALQEGTRAELRAFLLAGPDDNAVGQRKGAP